MLPKENSILAYEVAFISSWNLRGSVPSPPLPKFSPHMLIPRSSGRDTIFLVTIIDRSFAAAVARALGFARLLSGFFHRLLAHKAGGGHSSVATSATVRYSRRPRNLSRHLCRSSAFKIQQCSSLSMCPRVPTCIQQPREICACANCKLNRRAPGLVQALAMAYFGGIQG
jgi:hypothetical protein